jgi:hypothetical protein
MTKRYLGNIITQNPTAPAGPFENDAAPGVWSLAEALAYQKAGLWPIPGNVAPYALLGLTETPQRILIPSLGNSVSWGNDGLATRSVAQACASSTRGVWAGGSTNSSTIDYMLFSTSGSGADFGDLVYGKTTQGAGFGSDTRGIFAGGQGDPRDSIQYITIASTGNATVFGSLTSEDFSQGSGGFSSTTRGVLAESSNQNTNNIDYLTIASTGNSTNFGTYGSPLDRNDFCGASNSTRGLFAGGWDGSSSNYNVIDYVTIASTGNTTDFGDLTLSRRGLGGAASSTRAIFMGGSTGTIRNTIDYVEIASTGNAADFGDLFRSSHNHAGCSNSHGGIA